MENKKNSNGQRGEEFLEKKIDFGFEDKKRVRSKLQIQSMIQILIIVISIFSIPYIFHSTSDLISIAASETDGEKENSIESALVGFLLDSLDIIPSVSAQTFPDQFSHPLSQLSLDDLLSGQPLQPGPKANCCIKTTTGATCQEISSDLIGEICDEGNIVPTECEQVSSCVQGCCIDPVEGLCSERSTKGVCEENGGTWSDDVNCNIAECRLGCCVVGDEAQYVTDQRCSLVSAQHGFEKDYRPVEAELECLGLSLSDTLGACIVPGGCKLVTVQECNAIGGTGFHEGLLCSNPSLETGCERQSSVSCLEGKEEIYWFDSCGNRENIYSSDKDFSFSDGEVLTREESCNPTSGNANSKNCGNCNYLLGSTCTETNSRRGVKDGNFVCQDLSCSSSKETGGQRRENGESWCVYDGYIGDGKDTPGSRHWRRICVEGKVEVEPCADYRGQICVESESIGNGKSFTGAACVVNQAVECISYNQDQETAEQKCLENSQCQLAEVDVDDDYDFKVCTGKYPGGFDFSAETDTRTASTAASLCGQSTLKCTAVYEKKIDHGKTLGTGTIQGEWECVANCDCEEEEFAEKLNNLCVSLGDCGTYVNYLGKGTNNIVVENSPDVSWGEYAQYATPVPGQKAEPESIQKSLGRFSPVSSVSFGGDEFDPDSGLEGIKSFGKTVGALGIATKGYTVVAYTGSQFNFGVTGFKAGLAGIKSSAWTGIKGVLPGGGGGSNLLITSETNFANVFGSAIPYFQVAGSALAGAALGVVAGQLIAKVFGLQGDAAMVLAVAGAIGGALVGLGWGLNTFLGWVGGISSCGPAIIVCIIVLIIILIVIAIVLKLSGIGEVEEVEVSFSCAPWQPPVGSFDCDKCNNDPLKPCSKYRCESLGAGCEIADAETLTPVCVGQINLGGSPNIFAKETSSGFKFENKRNNGVKVVSDSGECIPEFTPVRFVLGTDREAQCKYDFRSSNNYDAFSNFPEEGTFYTGDHTFNAALPSLSALQELGIPLQGDITGEFANIKMYVKCQDVHGNTNKQNYAVDLCVSEQDDITPPVIVGYIPGNLASLPLETTETNLTVILNEPAECKYDSEPGKTYDEMANTLNCNTDLLQGGNFGWMCDTHLDNLVPDENEFYFKCKDQPWLQGTADESMRNTNVQDMPYTLLITSNALRISSVSPSGEISSGVEPMTVDLEITTEGGINNGKSICDFSFNNPDNNIGFRFTGGTSHKQVFGNLISGDYNIFLNCKDDAGNIATGNAEFTLSLDTTPPTATRIFRSGDSLKLSTNEDAKCYYDLTKCNFNEDNATSMTTAFSTEHSAPWNPGKTHYIKCFDIWDNGPSSCTARVFPSEF